MEYRAFPVAPCKPGEYDPDSGKWLGQRVTDGHTVFTTPESHTTKTAALQAAGATLTRYHVEAFVRDAGAQGVHSAAVFRDVPLYEMTTDAAVDGLHAFTNHGIEVERVRTIWSLQNAS